MLSECHIEYGTPTSNHFPLSYVLDLDVCSLNMYKPVGEEEVIKWSFDNENLVYRFYENLYRKLEELHVGDCNVYNCTLTAYFTKLDNCYQQITDLICEAGRRTFGSSHSRKFLTVPGWNDFVRQYHEQARHAFLLWRSCGSPREGDVAEMMRAARARFKLALSVGRTMIR